MAFLLDRDAANGSKAGKIVWDFNAFVIGDSDHYS
jgi:hypothetical protein